MSEGGPEFPDDSFQNLANKSLQKRAENVESLIVTLVNSSTSQTPNETVTSTVIQTSTVSQQSTNSTNHSTTKDNTWKISSSDSPALYNTSSSFDSFNNGGDQSLNNEKNDDSNKSNRKELWPIILICVGAVVVLAVISLVVALIIRYYIKQKKNTHNQESKVVKKRTPPQQPTPKKAKNPEMCFPQDEINEKNFKFRGPLHMPARVKGDLVHETSGQQSGEIDVGFDKNLNEVVDIGSDVEFVDETVLDESQTTGGSSGFTQSTDTRRTSKTNSKISKPKKKGKKRNE